MHNYRKPHNPGKIRRATCWLVLAWASLIAAGCSTTGTGPEPLVGEIHPQKQNIYGPNPPTPTGIPTKTSSASDPLLGGSSNLASIPNARPALAINDNIATSGYGNTAFTSGFTTTAGGNGPTVMPLSDPANQAPGSFVPGTPTAEILQAQLRARGVIWQKQETVPDGVRFTAVVPNRYNPESCTAYDATARDYVTAIQAVLVQIDRP